MSYQVIARKWRPQTFKDLVGQGHVSYTLAASPNKVVILDEAHMLTGEASNALLKTLEEPPDRVIFVMATTEPENLVDTIRSRSQHFHFRALTFAEITGRLQE